MNFKESVKMCLGPKYLFKVSGRASRSEFWWFMLFVFLVDLGSGVVCSLLPAVVGGSVALIISLLLFPANFGVTVRRFHDRDLSGWWLAFPIGALMLAIATGGVGNTSPTSAIIYFAMSLGYLIILCLPGTPGPNKYGPSPALSD